MIENHFGSLSRAWHASRNELKRCGLDDNITEMVIDCRSKIDLQFEVDRMNKHGIRAISHKDEGYPERLKQIYDFPPLLFIKGELLPEDEIGVAIVGSRDMTSYGRQVTEELASELVKSGITIISGMARGVDSIAHQAALSAGGRTIAVCAAGLDIIYPPSNSALASKIIRRGAIVSEYAPGTKPRPEYFPRRNRIMSGMALGVLLTEARKESGALITAKLALDYNREVFAVPGSIYSQGSKGCNWLLQEGAKVVTKANDVLEELNIPVLNSQQKMKEVIPGDEVECAIIKALTFEPLHVDALVRVSNFSTARITASLAIMEIKGWVKQVGAMTYALTGNR